MTPETPESAVSNNPNFRCGTVSIVGRPNVGKSTLLNSILEEKVAIVTKVPQTTRNQIRGVYTEERGQIIFIDTPGLHLGTDRLDQFMNQAALSALSDVDAVIHLMDTSRKVGPEEENVVQKLKSLNKPIILGLNKIDLKGKHLPEYIELWEKTRGTSIDKISCVTLMALSSRDRTNLDTLLDVLFDLLPPGPALYPADIICDVPRKMAMADIIREKLFGLLRQELPHALGVIIEDVQPRRHNILNIKALLMVERDRQKEIVIGRKGEVLKKAGTQARKELEELLDQKVFLELYVKVQKNWRDDASLLMECGYSLM